MSNRLLDLLDRIRRIRLPQKVIAAEAGLDETTISRTLLGRTDPLNSTLVRIEQVVAAHEADMREKLRMGAA